MYVRRLKTKSGKTYIQVIDKSKGKYKVVKSFGSGSNEKEIRVLISQAKQWIDNKLGVQKLNFNISDPTIDDFFSSITQMRLVGIELLLGEIFDAIGFNILNDEIFKQLTIYRIAFPKSKLKTTEYLRRYVGIDWNEDKIYRYLDKLQSKQKEIIQKVSYEHTKKTLGGVISIVFMM